MAAQDIVIRPIITEKSMSGMAEKKYAFEVRKDANKIEIAKAVEENRGLHPLLEESLCYPERG